MKENYKKLFSEISDDVEIRSLDYVVAECEKLVDQIVELSEG